MKNKFLLIDITSLKGNITGIERYVFEISNSFADEQNVYYLATDETEVKSITNKNNIIYVNKKKKKLFDIATTFIQLDFKILLKEEFDNYLFPNFKSYRANGNIYTIIHDLTYKNKGRLNAISRVKLKIKIKQSIHNSKKILTVSEGIAKELKDDFNGINVIVASPGVSKIFKQSFLENSTKTNKNFLFVGSLNKRKNISFLIETFKKLDDSFCLTICGKIDNDYDSLLSQAAGMKNINFVVDANDGDLINLYKKNSFLLSSSIYEGFGMQIPEAVTMGLKPILSDIVAHREVAPNGSLYFDLSEEDSLYTIINKLNFDENIQKPTVEYLDKYSWENTKRILLSEFRSAL